MSGSLSPSLHKVSSRKDIVMFIVMPIVVWNEFILYYVGSFHFDAMSQGVKLIRLL